MIVLRPQLLLALLCWNVTSLAVAAPVSLSEQPGEGVYSVTADVTIQGQIRTHGAKGGLDERPLTATARFAFLETAVDGGTDQRLRRVVRQYTSAQAKTNVDGFETTTALPTALRRVVISGQSDGPVRFSLDGLMTREAVDLLDMPGDPIVLGALLPDREVEIDEAYDVADWVAQMLCSLDVLTEADLVGRVRSATDESAAIVLTGTVEGARLGAPTKLTVTGSLTFDRRQNVVTRAVVKYEEDAEIGTISPGLKATTQVDLVRRRSTETVNTAGVPSDIPPAALKLYLDAPSWGVRMLHDRDWHVFYAAPAGTPPVVILRLLDNGRLLSQVNLAKLNTVEAGQQAPIEKFEADIQMSLGDRFGQFLDRTKETRDDSVTLYRVVASGAFDYKQADETKTRAMQWTYFLVVHPDGRQFSAVFAHEPDVAEQLAGRDRELIGKLQFFAPQVAAAK